MSRFSAMKFKSPLWFILIVIFSVSCSTARKAELNAGKDPEKAVAEVTLIMQQAYRDQLDMLADEAFSDGKDYLTAAKRGLKEGELVEAILENAGIAKAFFQDAVKVAEPKRPAFRRILEARAAALSAGVRKSEQLTQGLKDADDELKDITNQFSRTLKPEVLTKFQKNYQTLEAKAVQHRELGGAKQVIDKARGNDAEDLAPKSLKSASTDYDAAMKAIAIEPRNPDKYGASVNKALDSATLLRDVMDIILGAKGTPEHIALQIVMQKRKLGELTSSVGRLEQNLQTTQQTLEQKEGALKEKESALKQKETALQQKESALQQKDTALKQTQGELEQTQGALKAQEEVLAKASYQVRFQQAMDEAREMIPETEALVYQQGNKLVFRLKRINFPSGTAIIPEFSKLVIDKVDSIIKKLDADKVVVQGHTDSVGSEMINKKLSNDRALAVAKYMHNLKGGYKITYVGYGETHPIASNETSAGRAMNRRVDLVISVKQ